MEFSARFWSKVDQGGGPEACWPWTAARFAAEGVGSYGAFWLNGRNEKAHRVAFLLTRGDLGGQLVLHACDNPPCCNPAHLRLGTHADNSADAVDRGRQVRGARVGLAKLTDEAARSIREARTRRCACAGERCSRACPTPRVPLRVLAKRFGVTMAVVSAIALGQTWAAA